jgi:lysozyme
MKLVADWRRVVALSISFWAQVLGLFALILPELAYAVWGVEFDPYVLWWVGVGFLLFGIAGRLVVQSGSALVNLLRIAAVALLILGVSVLAASAAPATEAETLAIAVPFIGEREGMRLVAYLDIVGVPTICAGSTRGVTLGMRKTLAECTALLRAEVAEYRRGLHRYFTAETIALRLPARRDAAFTSLAFNVGIGAVGKSTAVRRLNASDVPGACDAITWWNKAGQRVVRGLVIRRAAERDLCRDGLPA